MYNYILIIFLIIILYVITHENFETCKIIKCSSGYSLSLYGQKCCTTKDNVSSYDNKDCSILGCNVGYTLSDDRQTCCKNVVGDATYKGYASNYDSSCNITKCVGNDKISGDKKSCCLSTPGISTFDNTTCKPTTCSSNYKLSDGGEKCCYNPGDNTSIQYNNSCNITKCQANYYLNNGTCNYCDPSKAISKFENNCCTKISGATEYGSGCQVLTCDNGNLPRDNCKCNMPIDAYDDKKIRDLIVAYWNVNKFYYHYQDMIIFDMEKYEDNAYQVLYTYTNTAYGYNNVYTVLQNFYYIIENCQIIFNKTIPFKNSSGTNNYGQIIHNMYIDTINMKPYIYITITTKINGGCLDEDNGKIYFNKNIVNYADQQKWMLVKNRYLVNKFSGNYLTVDNNNNLIPSKFDGNLNQEFNILWAEDNEFFFIKNNTKGKGLFFNGNDTINLQDLNNPILGINYNNNFKFKQIENL